MLMLGERTRPQNLNYLVGSLGLNGKGRYSRDRREKVVGYGLEAETALKQAAKGKRSCR